MLYKFKSPEAADVIMLKPSAEEILKIIGKSPGPTGIVTAAQAASAVAALKAEIPSVRIIIHVEPDDEAKLPKGTVAVPFA